MVWPLVSQQAPTYSPLKQRAEGNSACRLGLPAWAATGYHVGTSLLCSSPPGSLVADSPLHRTRKAEGASGGEATNRSGPSFPRPRPRYCCSSSCRRAAGGPATGCWSARAHSSRVVAAASGRQLARGQDKSAASQTQLQSPARQQQQARFVRV